MEPSGRKQWQPVADAPAAKPQEQAKSVAVGCEPLPLNLDGKDGVDGSVRQRACSKALQMAFSVACDGEIETLRGYETGTFWDWRARRAGTRDISRRSERRARDSRSRPPARKVLRSASMYCKLGATRSIRLLSSHS